MIRIPALRPDLILDVIAHQRVVFSSAAESREFEGDLYCAVVGEIDGRRTAREIVTVLERLYRPEEIYYVLAILAREGLTVESSAAASRDAAWWYSAGVPVEQARDRLAATPVRIAACDGMDASAFAAALCSMGVRVQPDARVRVLLTADPLGGACRDFHQESLHSGDPWMLVQPMARVGWIGPLFRPGVTGCWECLRRRLEENRFRAAPPQVPSPGLIANAAAIQLALWISGVPCEIEGAILTLDQVQLTRARHELVRLPQCPDCGEPHTSLPDAALVLESRPKVFVADGGHRVRTPAETRAGLERHVSELTGTVRNVGKTSDSAIVHVFTAHYNTPRSDSASSSAGKGIGEDQAWCSCVAEALERGSAYYRGDEPLVRAPWEQMRGRAVHPDTLTMFSARQYETDCVPAPFDEAAVIDWCAAWSLSTASVRYLPAAWAFIAYRAPWCRGDSNGCAGGNTVEEAILQGFLELVERDAVAIWWYNRLHRPGVDIDSFDNPAFAALRAEMKSLRRALCLLDVTSDLNIPCLVAASWREDGSGIVLGFGAHLDARLAASRALTELKQLLPSPEGSYAGEGDEEWMQQVTISNQPCVCPAAGAPKTVHDFPALASVDLRDDITRCAGIVAGRGMDFLVLNLTRPDIGFPVVRVAVPGLRHFRPRFAPGRLYQVPVEMGWLDAPLSEDQLNPVPIRT